MQLRQFMIKLILCKFSFLQSQSHFAELQPLIVGVAVLAVQSVVSHSDISSLLTIAQLDAAYATLEASNVVKQAETLNYHCCPAAEFLLAVAAALLSTDAQHPILPVSSLTQARWNLRSRNLRSWLPVVLVEVEV